MEAAKGNRHGNGDATMVLLAYRHGLRASELVELRCGGIRWTSERHPCTSAGPSRALPARIPSSVTNSGRYGGSSANSRQNRSSSSRLSGARHLPPPVSPGWSSEQGLKPSSGSKPTRTCSGMPAAMRSPTEDTIQGRCRHTSATAIQHTVRYTELSPTRFKNFWRE